MSEKNSELTFEQAIERLEKIVASLEDGKAPLDSALKLFEDGVKLVTAYRCTVSKARAMMGKELPKSLKKTIERNLRMYGNC